jgi:superfamily II DNA or RNA helicase
MSTASHKGCHEAFPQAMSFKSTWRLYQERLLGQLDSYLENRRLHLIAAPGSGKTVLGLEVIRRIGKRTLVLAPTITIRNQWADRLVDHFLPAGERLPCWVSMDLRHPQPLTIATYQALHAICSGEPHDEAEPHEDEDGAFDPSQVELGESARRGAVVVPEVLTRAGFKTLVVDEAHHLRAEWWKTLTSFVDHLDDPAIVALTATPPYDVSPLEWHRYEKLCGPVDAEVSIPELVLQGDLCPHQDYLYFSAPAEREQTALSAFRANVDSFVERLRANPTFTAAIAAHPWVTAPEAHVEEILTDPQYVSSMVVYLHAAGEAVPAEVLDTLGLARKRIPALDLDWLETLLSRFLHGDADSVSPSAALVSSLRRELLEIGAIEHRMVKLRNPSNHMKLLTTSVTKLKSIEEIVKLEAGALGDDLRCVILTDFIRKTEMPKHAGERPAFEDIGIVPIFESLRRADLAGIRLGVLSGSIVVIPAAAAKLIREAATAFGVRSGDLSIMQLPHDAGYSTVELHGDDHRGMVRLITAVFEQGGVSVLVGTKSLLGEGWDAPTINTLILASFVGSYVLSNQMRGRSIRVDSNRLEKTANIWHLVCVEPGKLGPGGDYELLARRCRAFVGVSETAPMIESGTGRFGLPPPPFTREQIGQINTLVCNRALDRAGLRQRWQEALVAGTSRKMVDGVKSAVEALPRGFVLTSTIGSLLVEAVLIFQVAFLQLRRLPIHLRTERERLAYLLVLAVIAAAVSLPWVFLGLWRFIRHGTPERSIKRIGEALLESLAQVRSIKRPAHDFRIDARRNRDGTVSCWVGGGSGKEQAVFLHALREIVGPIDDPRYLLARRRLWRIFREDYFAVPDVLARRRSSAEAFASKWRNRVGPVQLVYTRTLEGRRLLLRARVHSLAAAFQKHSEHVSCWR